MIRDAASVILLRQAAEAFDVNAFGLISGGSSSASGNIWESYIDNTTYGFTPTTPEWILNGSGDWNVGANWIGGIPNAADAVAPFQVERQAPFAAIDAEKIGAPRPHERRPRPRIVARAGFLDFDDVGAHIAEEHRAEWARQDARQIDDFQPVEWWHLWY